MNRELIFRGFHPCDGPDTIVVDGEKVKGRWVEGYYVERDNKSWIYPASNQMISKSLARELRPFHSAKSTQKIMKEVFPVLPPTAGQYTGRTDKNGKRIFEGDILSIKNPRPFVPWISKVMYEDCCFWLKDNRGVIRMLADYADSEAEVIGTVFDEEAQHDN